MQKTSFSKTLNLVMNMSFDVFRPVNASWLAIRRKDTRTVVFFCFWLGYIVNYPYVLLRKTTKTMNVVSQNPNLIVIFNQTVLLTYSVKDT